MSMSSGKGAVAGVKGWLSGGMLNSIYMFVEHIIRAAMRQAGGGVRMAGPPPTFCREGLRVACASILGGVLLGSLGQLPASQPKMWTFSGLLQHKPLWLSAALDSCKEASASECS